MIDGTGTHIEFAPALMTRELAAYYLSVSIREIDLMRGRGEISAYGDAKRIKFKKTELDEWIAKLKPRNDGYPHGLTKRSWERISRTDF